MEQPFEYVIDDKVFYSRLKFIEHCQSQNNSIQLFNTAEFRYNGLPDVIDVTEKIDPLLATAEWIKELKQDKKPIVLMFSGGLDSIFALDCMVKSDCPPDYLFTYTGDPFDRPGFYCGTYIETNYAIRYAEEIIKNNSKLRHTKIWHIHLDQKSAEQHFADDTWLHRGVSWNFSVESFMPGRLLTHMTDDERDKYTFVHGGNFPKIKIVDQKPCFYLVDRQLCASLDVPENQRTKSRDFVLDNPKMFKYLCSQYYDYFKDNLGRIKEDRSLERMFECHGDHADKRYLKDFNRFIPTMPPQLEKRFDNAIPYIDSSEIDDSLPLHVYLNRSPFKAWLVYLQAELFKPKWFDNYKKTISSNQDWIKKMIAYPGKITKFINIQDQQ